MRRLKKRRPMPQLKKRRLMRLRLMAQKLEQMNLFLRCSPLPTLTEIRLYGLIWGHVSSNINLFLWEKYYFYVMNLPPCSDKQEREEGSSPFRPIRDYIVRNNITCSDEIRDEDGDNDHDPPISVAGRLFDLMTQPDGLAKLLRQLRHEVGLPQASNSKKPPTVENENEASSKDKSSNEHILLCILRSLEERGRSRRYAPPSDEEIRYYCEIRKWTTSSLSYIQGRFIWHKQQNPSANDERGIHAHVPIEWHAGLLWPGQKMAGALYEIPELQSLMEQCRHRFKEAVVSFSEHQDVATAVAERVGNSEGKNSSHIRKVIKKRKRDGLAAGAAMEDVHYGEATVGDRLGCGAWTQHLLDIQKTLRQMATSPLTAAPTLRQIRLYAQLEEHVNSSIWMIEFEVDYLKQGGETFELSQEDQDEGDSSKYGGETFELSKEDQDEGDSSKYDVDMESEEGKTREQYLEEIVCSVEAIKSSFTGYPPTRQVVLIYRFLRSYLFPDFVDTQFFQKQGTGVRTKHIFSREEVAMVKHLCGLVCVKLEELLKVVSEQWLEMLRLARVEVPIEVEAGDVLKWLFCDKCNETRALTGLKDLLSKSSQGIEMLDHLSLILEEMSLIPVSCLSKLYCASSSWYNQMYILKNYETVCMEISAALHTPPLNFQSQKDSRDTNSIKLDQE